MKIKNKEYKLQVLAESYKEVEGCASFREYIDLGRQTDHNFLNWLFDEHDSDIDLSDVEEEFTAFLDAADEYEEYVINK